MKQRVGGRDLDEPFAVLRRDAHAAGDDDHGAPAYALVERLRDYGVAIDRSELMFPSGDSHCAAWLYRPAGEASSCVVDPDRVVLWGFSFSGGHVVETAAADQRIVAEGSPWRNEISPAVFLSVALHRPLRLARRLRAPLWVGLGERDVSVSRRAVERLAARAAQAELHRYPYDHFEAFIGGGPERVAGDQVDFLRRRQLLDG